MSSDLKEIARRFYEEFWNAGDESVADELVAGDFFDHHVPPEIPKGPEGVKQWAAIAKGGFPDFHIQVHQMIAEADRVACHLEFSGTHNGEFAGVAPTGNPISAEAISILRVENGKLAEGWEFADVPKLLEPLGIVLGPAGG